MSHAIASSTRGSILCLALSAALALAACSGSNNGGGDTSLGGTAGALGAVGGAGLGGTDATMGGASAGGADATMGGASAGGTDATMGGASAGGADATMGGTDAGGADATMGGASAGGATSSTGCGQSAPAIAPGSVLVGDLERTFIVDVPAAYDPNQPTPVLFGFHGAGNSGEAYRSQYYGNLLSTFGDSFIVVHPDALANDQGTTAWDFQGGPDVDFFDAMLSLLESTYCVDDNRVFATGHSSGGFFTNVLACQRGDRLRAVGPQSGGGPMMFGGATCTGQVAAIVLHGLSDPTVDITSGEGSRDYYLEANHCDSTLTTTPSSDYPCVEYGGCDTGFPVRWCAYEGDHGPADFAPQALYDFFSAL